MSVKVGESSKSQLFNRSTNQNQNLPITTTDHCGQSLNVFDGQYQHQTAFNNNPFATFLYRLYGLFIHACIIR
jgi:hypothetical protein